MKKITKQKQVGFESKNNNELWQISLDAMNDAVFIIDVEHKILQCNKATLDILGKSSYHEIIGHSCGELVHCGSEPDDWCPVRKMWETGHRETDVQLLNGKWVKISAEPVLNDQGEITGAIHIITDIDARKRAEDALTESKQQYLTILNSLNDAMHVVDKDLRINFQNPAMNQWLELLDLNPDNIGKTVFEAFPFIDHDKVYNEYSKIFKDKEPLITVEATKLSDRYIYTETLKIPVVSEGQVNQIITILRDITDQREFERNLKASEEKYRYLIENALEGVWVIDSNANTTLVNPSMANILGYSVDEMIGKSLFSFMDEEQVKIAKNHLERRKKGIAEERDAAFRHKSGNKVYLKVRASPIFNSEGKYEGTYAFLANLTKQTLVEKELKKSEEKFRNIFEAIPIGMFLYEYASDGELVFRESNPASDKILNVDTTQFVNKTIEEAFPPLIHTDIPQRCKKIAREGGTRKWNQVDYNYNQIEGKYEVVAFQTTPGFMVTSFTDESNRIEAEIKLRESEEKFRTIAEQSFMGIIVLQDGIFKYFNEQAAKINGYPIEEIQNWKPYEFSKIIYPEDKEFVMEQARKKQLGDPDVISHYRYRIIKKNGEVVWLENFSKTINFGGKPADLVMTIDINDKIKAEQKLIESEEKYRLISENTDDLIVVYNESGIIEYLNAETHSRVLGYNPDRFLDKSFRDALVHKDDKEIADKSGSKGLEKGNFQYQFRVKHENGNYLWFEVTGKTFLDNYGNKKILCISRNINDKKLAEQKIKESEENFRTIAEQAFIGTLIIQDDKVEYVNNALLQIFDFSHEEINNWTKDDLLKLIYPEDLQYLREYREKLRNGEFELKPYYSYRVFTKYGKVKWIDQFSRPIIYREKPAELVTIMDITEKKKAEQELIKLNSLKSELLRRTSHELKTPLVSIKGFSDLLLTVHKDKLDDYVLATIHEIKLGCERLENLIHDILKTSELESESVELKKSEEDLSFLIKLCIRELQGLIKLRNHEIHLNIHDKLITRFEPDQIHLVISNLLNNAIKYTPPNGKIEIKSAITDDYILVSIHDNGIGITSEEKKRLFSQFGKIERYGQGLDIISDGSGLGLFITKKIIELHGGSIRVRSKGRNKGSTFYFTLPLIK
ncbi:MAG: PAS domain S-box protein [Candidatus Hermodarchaeota archaeon]